MLSRLRNRRRRNQDSGVVTGQTVVTTVTDEMGMMPPIVDPYFMYVAPSILDSNGDWNGYSDWNAGRDSGSDISSDNSSYDGGISYDTSPSSDSSSSDFGGTDFGSSSDFGSSDFGSSDGGFGS